MIKSSTFNRIGDFDGNASPLEFLFLEESRAAASLIRLNFVSIFSPPTIKLFSRSSLVRDGFHLQLKRFSVTYSALSGRRSRDMLFQGSLPTRGGDVYDPNSILPKFTPRTGTLRAQLDGFERKLFCFVISKR